MGCHTRQAGGLDIMKKLFLTPCAFDGSETFDINTHFSDPQQTTFGNTFDGNLNQNDINLPQGVQAGNQKPVKPIQSIPSSTKSKIISNNLRFSNRSDRFETVKVGENHLAVNPDYNTLDGEPFNDPSEYPSNSNPFKSALEQCDFDEFDEKQQKLDRKRSIINLLDHNHRVILSVDSPLSSARSDFGIKEHLVSGSNHDHIQRSVPYQIDPSLLPPPPPNGSCLLPFESEPEFIPFHAIHDQSIRDGALSRHYKPTALFIDFKESDRLRVRQHIESSSQRPERYDVDHGIEYDSDIYREFNRHICIVELDAKPAPIALDVPRLKLANPEIERRLTALLTRYNESMARTWADCGLLEGVYLSLNLKPGSKS